jgi:Raf kinase inhibitor-like YbhB/YbcL family protein
MRLTSSAFPDKGIIPSCYTCEGANISPPLEIASVPEQTKSLVLIMDDPDVPAHVRSEKIWDHWIIFNMLPNIRHIPEMTGPASGTFGKTTFGHTRYGGPCPPDREHRYFFKLYALDILLPLKEGATKKEIEKAMQGHILAETQLMGRYEKGKGY